MKKLLIPFIGIVAMLCSCGQNKGEKKQDPPEFTPLVSNGDMSIGSENGKQSKAYWDYLRFHNPETGHIPFNIREREIEFSKSLPQNYNRDFSWEQRGPVNIGGRTRAVVIDVLDESIWLAGGVTGGIWRSEDAGESWEKVTAMSQIHSVTSIVQDTRPGHENTWYAGTGEYYTVVSHATFDSRFSGNGILKSTDNGLTWTELESTQSNTPQTTYEAEGDMDYVWKLVIDKSDMSNDVVLAAVYNGIYRSEDGGDTWDQVHGFEVGGTFDNQACDYLDLVATDDGVFYATYSSDGIGKGVYRSEDGLTWTDITPGLFPSAYGRMVMALNPLNQDVVWLFGDTNGSYGNGHSVLRYEYLSGDGTGAGGVWEDRSEFLPHEDCLISEIGFQAGYLNTQNSFDVTIAVHPTDTNMIYIAGTSIWRNADGFTHDSTNTWIGGYYCSPYPYDSPEFQTSYPNHHPDQHVLTFLPSDSSKLINGNDGGIYVTVDCLADTVSWESKNNGYVTTQFYAIAIEPGETYNDAIIGGMQDNNTFVTMHSEFDSAWTKVTGGDGMFCAITEDAEYYLACKQYGRLFAYKLDDNGDPIAYERIDPSGGPSSYNWANRYILDPNNSKRVYWNGRYRIWRLDNLDDIDLTNDKTNKEPGHWEVIDESETSGSEGIITDIEASPTWQNTIWYGTNRGKLYRVNYADDNDAAIRTDLTDEKFPGTTSWLASIAVNPENHDEIVICFANYKIPSIFHTTDGGQSWTDISGNLEENTDGSGAGPSVLWMEYYPNGTLFSGTSTGLYTTTFPDDSNTVWVHEPGIGNVIINHMDYRTWDGKFVVGTHGNGVYSTNLPSYNVGVEEETEQTEELSLYPTATNSLINVNGIDSFERYYIFDLNGRPVYNGQKTSDVQQIDVRHFTAGTYLFVATDGEEKVVRKFVVR